MKRLMICNYVVYESYNYKINEISYNARFRQLNLGTTLNFKTVPKLSCCLLSEISIFKIAVDLIKYLH